MMQGMTASNISSRRCSGGQARPGDELLHAAFMAWRRSAACWRARWRTGSAHRARSCSRLLLHRGRAVVLVAAARYSPRDAAVYEQLGIIAHPSPVQEQGRR